MRRLSTIAVVLFPLAAIVALAGASFLAGVDSSTHCRTHFSTIQGLGDVQLLTPALPAAGHTPLLLAEENGNGGDEEDGEGENDKKDDEGEKEEEGGGGGWDRLWDASKLG